MKRLLLSAFTLLLMLSASAQIDLKSILGGLAGGNSSEGSDNNTVSAITGILGNLLSSDKISVESMVGNWSYTAPAVSFKSENLLMKAGGSAAASTIESKLAPYYKTAGIESLVLTVNSDSTFTMKVKAVTLQGTISQSTGKNSQANFMFNFKALGKIGIGKMDTYVTMTGTGTMNLMFDVSKLVDILTKVASLSGNSTIQGVTSLLNNYDGVCAGFKLKKTK